MPRKKTDNSILAYDGFVWVRLSGALTVLTPRAAEVIQKQIQDSISKARKQNPKSSFQNE